MPIQVTSTSPLPGVRLGVLVPVDGVPSGDPAARPIGRAALLLAEEGVDLVFGATVRAGRMSGLWARPSGWTRAEDVQVAAIHDRFPSQGRAAAHAEVVAELSGVPLANPPWLVELCRDKLVCQRTLERAGVPQPEVEGDAARFAARLDAWGAGFLKPRYGSFGVGVRRVVAGDGLPAALPGNLQGALEPAVLQRAIRPPEGWAGISVRVNAQRRPEGGWCLNPGVARRSVNDPVVNAHRGAEVAPADDVLGHATLAELYQRALEVAEALGALPGGEWVVELGVDLVVDREGRAHVIEVNGRPQGRLGALASRWGDRFGRAHLDAVARPLRYLAARVQ
ncbi:MAG: hypothetical protein JXX28_17075 [Deltaproteobacteria bacterium]|nr:hypothetical protein [Deltaproteobacteria bacterium]